MEQEHRELIRQKLLQKKKSWSKIGTYMQEKIDNSSKVINESQI